MFIKKFVLDSLLWKGGVICLEIRKDRLRWSF